MNPTRRKKFTAKPSSKASRPASRSSKPKAEPKGAKPSSRGFGSFSKLEDLLALPLLDREAELEATPLELFERNTRAAVFLAAKLSSNSPHRLDDAVGAALRGLWHAAQRYVPSKNSFLSYAAWSIKRYVLDELRTSVIEIPQHARVSAAAVRDGRPVTDAQRRTVANLPTTTPLDLEMAEDGDTLHTAIPDREKSPDEAARLSDLREEIRAAFSGLPKKEAYVLTKRLGIDGGEPQSLQEIASHLGVTRERVRQIEFLALRQLRNSLPKRDFSLDDLQLL